MVVLVLSLVFIFSVVALHSMSSLPIFASLNFLLVVSSVSGEREANLGNCSHCETHEEVF